MKKAPPSPTLDLFGDPQSLPAAPKPATKPALEKSPPSATPLTFERLAEVALERPMRHTYTYIADGVRDTLAPGARVTVPFGKGTASGFYLGERPLEEFKQVGFDPAKLKQIVSVIGDGTGVTEDLVKLARWMSRHYVCPLGMVLKSMLPIGVKEGTKSKKTRFVSTHLSANELMIHAASLTVKKEKQAAILRALAERLSSAPVDAAELLSSADAPVTALKSLEKSKLLRIVEKSNFEIEAADTTHARTTNLILNDEQSVALKEIEAALASHEASGFLLQGVTGSGKTEVYLRALQIALAAGRQAIVLVPEIALTPQTAERFQSRLGRERVAVLASDEAKGERAEIWRAIRAGKIDVVVGARSALYAPLPRLGIIVVDEEHDSSYKSPAAPRYNARDAAIALARITRSTIILGSATPCFETYYAAKQGQLTHLILSKRATGQPMPPVAVVDLNRENVENEKYTIVSQLMKRELEKTLARGEQAILFLNRRGFSTVNKCLRCGNTEKCERCDIALTGHRDNKTLVCHYCNTKRPMSNVCSICHAPGLKTWGLGTERVEDEIVRLFPSVKDRIARMDSDTMNNSDKYAQTLGAFKDRKTDILIGTQMIAKGLDFPAVTLVGVLLADTALHMPDFRNRERTFQLISQVAGRAGRSELGGTVVVQTHLPTDISIKYAVAHDFETFYLEEMKERQAFGYPPFTRLARLVFSSKNKEALSGGSSALADALKMTVASNPELKSIQILGPSDAPISRIRDAFRKHILIKAPTSAQLSTLLDGPMADMLMKLKDVDGLIDVDALAML